MAKVKKSGKKAVKKIVSTPAAVAAAAPKKSGLMMVVIAAIVLFTAAEIYIVVQNNIRQSKKPEFVQSWPSEYKKGLTSMGEYGNYLYVVDNTTTGFVYKTDKRDGKLTYLYQLPELVYSAVEDSKGDIYILDKKNTVQVFYANNKPKRKIKLEGMEAAGWMEVDGKDNFYVVDLTNSYITKYDSDFNKVARFGGRGDGSGNFTNAGKVFAGPNDTLYCVNMLDTNKAQIKILDSNGKFKKAWPVKNLKKFSFLENLAVLPDGYVYINSFEGSSIFVFDANGKFMGSFDTDKSKRFLVTYPSSMTGGKNGLLYVATHQLAAFKPIKY